MFPDPLFADLSPKRRKIAVTYELIRFEPDRGRDTIVRRIAKRLGYSLDENRGNAFVSKTLRLYRERKGRLS